MEWENTNIPQTVVLALRSDNANVQEMFTLYGILSNSATAGPITPGMNLHPDAQDLSPLVIIENEGKFKNTAGDIDYRSQLRSLSPDQLSPGPVSKTTETFTLEPEPVSLESDMSRSGIWHDGSRTCEHSSHSWVKIRTSGAASRQTDMHVCASVPTDEGFVTSSVFEVSKETRCGEGGNGLHNLAVDSISPYIMNLGTAIPIGLSDESTHISETRTIIGGNTGSIDNSYNLHNNKDTFNKLSTAITHNNINHSICTLNSNQTLTAESAHGANNNSHTFVLTARTDIIDRQPLIKSDHKCNKSTAAAALDGYILPASERRKQNQITKVLSSVAAESMDSENAFKQNALSSETSDLTVSKSLESKTLSVTESEQRSDLEDMDVGTDDVIPVRFPNGEVAPQIDNPNTTSGNICELNRIPENKVQKSPLRVISTVGSSGRIHVSGSDIWKRDGTMQDITGSEDNQTRRNPVLTNNILHGTDSPKTVLSSIPSGSGSNTYFLVATETNANPSPNTISKDHSDNNSKMIVATVPQIVKFPVPISKPMLAKAHLKVFNPAIVHTSNTGEKPLNSAHVFPSSLQHSSSPAQSPNLRAFACQDAARHKTQAKSPVAISSNRCNARPTLVSSKPTKNIFTTNKTDSLCETSTGNGQIQDSLENNRSQNDANTGQFRSLGSFPVSNASESSLISSCKMQRNLSKANACARADNTMTAKEFTTVLNMEAPLSATVIRSQIVSGSITDQNGSVNGQQSSITGRRGSVSGQYGSDISQQKFTDDYGSVAGQHGSARNDHLSMQESHLCQISHQQEAVSSHHSLACPDMEFSETVTFEPSTLTSTESSDRGISSASPISSSSSMSSLGSALTNTTSTTATSPASSTTPASPPTDSNGGDTGRRLRNRSQRRFLPEKTRHKRQTLQDMSRPLKQWLYKHRENPYPSKNEKMELVNVSHMSLTQVSNWFANARRRLKNTVQGDELSWAKRIKDYNHYAEGNAELFSIPSSEEEDWDTEEEIANERREPHPRSESVTCQSSTPSPSTTSSFRDPAMTSPTTTMSRMTSPGGTTRDSPALEDNQGSYQKYKHSILQRYLHDASQQTLIPDDDAMTSRSRHRHLSSSTGSHDFEYLSTSSVSSPSHEMHHDSFDDFSEEFETIALRRRGTENQAVINNDAMYWKEIGAALALTTLSRSYISK